MIRIACIGTSHVACVKLGWDEISADHPDVAVTFFASPGKTARARTLQGMVYGFHDPTPAPGEIVFGNAGRRTIDLGAFDHVLQVRDGFKERELDDVLRTYVVDGMAADGRRLRMSQAAFDAICDVAVRQRLPRPEWHHWSAPRLTMAMAPYPDERCRIGQQTRRLQKWQSLAARPDELKTIRAAFFARFEAALADLGIALLRQPEKTLHPCGLTLAAYSVGSFRMGLNQNHDDRELEHMNTAYGRALIEAFLDRIQAPAQQPAQTPGPLTGIAREIVSQGATAS